MHLIAPSILSADFAHLGAEVSAVEKGGADWIHVDVMDGHFVPNITIGPLVVRAVQRVTALPLDVHLMIENADDFIPDFAKSGAHIITVHSEACTHLNRTLQLIRSLGVRPAVSLNPATPLSHLDYVLEYVDMVLIMSVNPGFGGQSFIPNSLKKIETLKNLIIQRGLDVLIQVDGGVNADTIGGIAEAGADVFVAGSAIFGSENYAETISRMKEILRDTNTDSST